MTRGRISGVFAAALLFLAQEHCTISRLRGDAPTTSLSLHKVREPGNAEFLYIVVIMTESL